MAEKSYRIRTDVTKDQVVRTQLRQDTDFLEILSLKIRQEDTYRLHVSNYGIIVGRVLANDAFGIPNAKVSVFIELDDADKLDSEIKNLYPYATIQTVDADNRRYNLLPDTSNDDCYRVVGTFPNKRLVLDNDAEIEVYEKYWKYTTVTNKSGDYMIFGVPCGTQQVHVDVDLSDIGVLSQKPRDFIYKGYSITQFDNSSQFKESTNLDGLSQLLSQTNSVHVYPFWGDTDVEEVAITRCDLQVQYKFEPTCVFFGSIVSDNFSNSVGDKCNPSKYSGFNRNLVAGEGTIEMIRKTQDGLVEEFQIQGNRLIDGDGVWCYQIPMNLDYVGTDEFGNIVPTDNPNKGIPTKTTVRFRISMQETNNEGVSRHRAKYLVPNVQQIYSGSTYPQIENPTKYVQCYEFGSATPDEYFRDLYWNKVYSVKNYIPRIQLGTQKNTQKYCAIRTVNNSGNLNPFPFNHGRFRLFFAYRVLCTLMSIILAIECAFNTFIAKIAGLKILVVRPFSWICSLVGCLSISGGLSEDEDNPIEYFPCCSYKKCRKCSEKGCQQETSFSKLMNVVQQSLAQEYDTVNLDFYNDWINGCLYMPLWFWKKTKKKSYLFGLFKKKAVNRYCNCDSNYKRIKVTEACSLNYDSNYGVSDSDKGEKFHYQFPSNPASIGHGIIKEVENKAGLKIYYYAPGVPTTTDYRDTSDKYVNYVRLYSTDIILLGSLNDCDLDNLPRPFLNMPSSSANIPYISTLKDSSTDSDVDNSGTEDDNGTVEVTGMDWLGSVNDGLFMDLTCSKVKTKPKTCVNLARMSELGVTLDSRYYDSVSNGTEIVYDNERPSDGLITRYELVDNETRAMFASLNHNGLTEKVHNPNTGYDTYKLTYMYPIDFDGHLSKFSSGYTKSMKVVTYDVKSDYYVNYVFGGNKYHFYSQSGSNYQQPLFNNSFFFYFGLNEGNTAIDKFNNMFYSECYKNVKYPFLVSVETTPAKWCKTYSYVYSGSSYNGIKKNELKESYATISVKISGIKTPYSYTLYDSSNEEIMSESDMYSEELKFGYKVANGGGSYEEEKYGLFTYLTDGKVVENETSDKKSKLYYLVDNDTYKLSITDTNGNTVDTTISIKQSPITVDVTANSLGDKYYSGTTEMTDLCNEASSNGEICINSVNIDGTNYKFKNGDSVSFKQDGSTISGDVTVYTYTTNSNGSISLGSDSDKVRLVISPSDDSMSFKEDCQCSDSTTPKSYKIENNILTLNVWVPQDYTVKVLQICNGSTNGNTSSDTVNVANGSPFQAYLNTVPMRFLLGKSQDVSNYNKKFYSKTVATSPTDTSMSGWFALQNESTYSFPSITKESDIDVWSDFVTLSSDSTDEDSSGADSISIDSVMAIIEYKFNSMMSMCMNCYIDTSDEKTMSLSHSGGKTPIVYRSCYPTYSEWSDTFTEDEELKDITFDSDGFVTCESSSPNIIGWNYTRYNNDIACDFEDNKTYSGSPTFNKLFTDYSHLGNYFAAFENTNNPKVMTSSPYNADMQSGTTSPSSYPSALYSGSKNPYFRGMFLDRRPDYDFFIMVPFNGEWNFISNEDEVRCGRIIGLQINGIEMAYDNSYNIIGSSKSDGLEYTIEGIADESVKFNKVDSKVKITYNTSSKNKRFYDAYVKGGNKIDLKDAYWSTDRNGIYGKRGLCNGDFSESNYPTLRWLDVSGITNSSKVVYSVTGCKYAQNLLSNEDDDYITYECEIEEGEETTFTVGANTSVSFVTSTLEQCAASSYGNITLNCTDSKGVSTLAELKSVDFTFTIPSDTSNETHRSYTMLPFVAFDDYRLQELVNTKNISGFTDMDKVVWFVFWSINFSGETVTDYSLSNSDVTVGEPLISRLALTSNDGKAKMFAFRKSDGSICFDGDSELTGLKYHYTCDVEKVSLSTAIEIVYFRHYLNESNDYLLKQIETFSIGAIINPILYISTENTKSYETKVLGVFGGEVEDASASDGSDSGTTADTSSNTSESSKLVNAATSAWTQTVEFTFLYAINSSLEEPSKLSAVAKVGSDILTNPTIEKKEGEHSDTLYITFKRDVTDFSKLSETNAELYLKRSNGLVFRFTNIILVDGQNDGN
jgi:hypothetical protein